MEKQYKLFTQQFEDKPRSENKSDASEKLKEATQIKNKYGQEDAIIFLDKLICTKIYSSLDIVRFIKRIIEYKMKTNSIKNTISYLNDFLQGKNIFLSEYIDLHCLLAKLLFNEDKILGLAYLTNVIEKDFTNYVFIKYYYELALMYRGV